MKTLALLTLSLATLAGAQTMPAVEATTRPTTAPSTQPTTQPTAATTHPVAPVVVTSRITGKTLTPPPAEYSSLTSRTMFIKTRVPPPPPVVTTQPVTITAPPVRLEATLVFNGVTDVDGVGYAVFEDTSAGKILGFKLGDAIANGKITAITLEGLTYEANGKSIHIYIGQTLDGSEPPDVMSRATVTGSSTTQPGSSTPAGAEDPILKALRERRKRELGQ